MAMDEQKEHIVDTVRDAIEDLPGIWKSDYPDKLYEVLENEVPSLQLDQIETLYGEIIGMYESWLKDNEFTAEEGLYCLADMSYGHYADDNMKGKLLDDVKDTLRNVSHGVEDMNGIANNPYFEIYGKKIYIYDRGPMRKPIIIQKYLDNVGVGYLWNKTKTYVAETTKQLKLEMANSYKLKGTISTLEELKAIPKSSLAVGDVYNVKENGMNYAWTGEEADDAYDQGWDALGGTIEIPTLTIEDIDRLLAED